MKGRILIDVPAHGLKCGAYVDLPDDLGKQLARDGVLDVQAVSVPAARLSAVSAETVEDSGPADPADPADPAESGEAEATDTTKPSRRRK